MRKGSACDSLFVVEFPCGGDRQVPESLARVQSPLHARAQHSSCTAAQRRRGRVSCKCLRWIVNHRDAEQSNEENIEGGPISVIDVMPPFF